MSIPMTRTTCTRTRVREKDTAGILTKPHANTIVAGEQQTMSYYMNVGNRQEAALGRALYQEYAQIGEQHISHCESLADPRETWLERLLLHEYNECYLCYSFVQEEPDDRIRTIWQNLLDCEIEHLPLGRTCSGSTKAAMRKVCCRRQDSRN
jgi:hypothetical protein